VLGSIGLSQDATLHQVNGADVGYTCHVVGELCASGGVVAAVHIGTESILQFIMLNGPFSQWQFDSVSRLFSFVHAASSFHAWVAKKFMSPPTEHTTSAP
jgi:hypothetical protein